MAHALEELGSMLMTARTFRQVGAALLMGALLSGCIISPQPEPPRIDTDRIDLQLISSDPDGEQSDAVIFVGQPGAVTPGGANLSITNLDRADTREELEVASDGSFSTTVLGLPGDMYRLQAWISERRSDPVDVIAPEEDGPAALAPRPLEDCLELTPPLELDFGEVTLDDSSVSAVILRNNCADEVIVNDIALLHAPSSFHTCQAEHASCLADGPDQCDQGAVDCENACEDVFRACTEGAEICEAHFAECTDVCGIEFDSCVAQTCGDALESCIAEASTSPLGFSLDVVVPLSVSSGTAESIILTFEPSQLGPAEDVMSIFINSPEIERRPITLIGEGVSP